MASPHHNTVTAGSQAPVITSLCQAMQKVNTT